VLLVALIRLALVSGLRLQAWLLATLLVVQILLGIESFISWLARAVDPASGFQESPMLELIRSGHYVVGAMVFAVTVAIAVKAHLGWAPSGISVSVPMPGKLEGAR